MNSTRKNSKKRQAILELIRSTNEHPSAEWIYAKLKPYYPNLSLGTVYRNLALFREEGIIKSLGPVAGQERFDADTSPHAHFICDVCGRVLDMPIPPVEDEFLRETQSATGASITACRFSFSGMCAECLRVSHPLESQ